MIWEIELKKMKQNWKERDNFLKECYDEVLFNKGEQKQNEKRELKKLKN